MRCSDVESGHSVPRNFAHSDNANRRFGTIFSEVGWVQVVLAQWNRAVRDFWTTVWELQLRCWSNSCGAWARWIRDDWGYNRWVLLLGLILASESYQGFGRVKKPTIVGDVSLFVQGTISIRYCSVRAGVCARARAWLSLPCTTDGQSL